MSPQQTALNSIEKSNQASGSVKKIVKPMRRCIDVNKEVCRDLSGEMRNIGKSGEYKFPNLILDQGIIFKLLHIN